MTTDADHQESVMNREFRPNELLSAAALEIRARVRRSYNDSARDYADATFRYEVFPGLRDEIAEFERGLPPGPVLDLGSGSGRDGVLLKSLGRDVVFADSSIALLTNGPRQRGGGKLVCCDACDLPFGRGCFGGVLASGVLLHLPRHACEAALREIHAVLRMGGELLASMKQGTTEGWEKGGGVRGERWFTYHNPSTFAEMCRSAGLRILDVRESERRNWFTVRSVR
jgi:tRNA (uracil-5-)-methyltransferase TRM9